MLGVFPVQQLPFWLVRDPGDGKGLEAPTEPQSGTLGCNHSSHSQRLARKLPHASQLPFPWISQSGQGPSGFSSCRLGHLLSGPSFPHQTTRSWAKSQLLSSTSSDSLGAD